MTILANVGRQYVLRILSRGDRPVVATHAVACNVSVIEVGRCPGDGGVAIVAVVAACDMCWVLAGRNDTVVTCGTTAEDLCVIDGHDRVPDRWAVAIFTNVRCLNMHGVFAGRIRTVMAIHAVAHNIHVIEVRRHPGNGGVAVFTVIAARNMCRMFASGSNTVVTGATTAQHLGVVDGDCRRPYRRAMAVLANVRCLNMGRALACCICAVMAGRTVARNIDVIEIRGYPGDCGVTAVAVIAACNVRRMLASCGSAVVTGATAAQYVSVVNSRHGLPMRRGVAVLADIRCLNMCTAFAGGIGAVVAAEAAADDIRVVEYGWHPSCGVMTIVTLIAGNDMVRCFSGCLHAVVARSATARH